MKVARGRCKRSTPLEVPAILGGGAPKCTESDDTVQHLCVSFPWSAAAPATALVCRRWRWPSSCSQPNTTEAPIRPAVASKTRAGVTLAREHLSKLAPSRPASWLRMRSYQEGKRPVSSTLQCVSPALVQPILGEEGPLYTGGFLHIKILLAKFLMRQNQCIFFFGEIFFYKHIRTKY